MIQYKNTVIQLNTGLVLRVKESQNICLRNYRNIQRGEKYQYGIRKRYKETDKRPKRTLKDNTKSFLQPKDEKRKRCDNEEVKEIEKVASLLYDYNFMIRFYILCIPILKT